MSNRRTYSVEVFADGAWYPLVHGETYALAIGYYLGRRDAIVPPSLACRMMRSDGVEIERSNAVDQVACGMIAGFPTPEQYERAAAVALDTARQLRARENERSERDRERNGKGVV